jgi:GTP-binding protein
MIVGMHGRDRDLDVNVCKERKVTNMRSSTQEIAVRLNAPVKFSLEEALDFVVGDELVEVTPKSIRLRKRVLDPEQRYRQARTSARHGRS